MEQHAYGGGGSAKSRAEYPIRLDRRNDHHHGDLLPRQPVILLRLAVQRSGDGQLDRRYRLTFSGLEGGAEFSRGVRREVRFGGFCNLGAWSVERLNSVECARALRDGSRKAVLQ